MPSPRLLIGTLFGLRIKDRAWLDHRRILLSAITAPSLLAQEDQSFEWAIFVGRKLPADIREALEEALTPFEGRAFIVQRGTCAAVALPALAQERGLVEAGGHVLTGRIDDDDAWHRGTVGAVRERVSAWLERRGASPGFGLTFENGLVWVMYDMLDMEQFERDGRRVVRRSAVRPMTSQFNSASVFVCTTPDAGIGSLSAQHSRVPVVMASRGFDIERVSNDRPMWLYCRHKQAGAGIHNSHADELELTLSDLVAEFGLDEARTQDYLATADRHGYSVVRVVGDRLGELERELREVAVKLDGGSVGALEADRLRREQTRLKDELTRLAENVVGSPGN